MTISCNSLHLDRKESFPGKKAWKNSDIPLPTRKLQQGRFAHSIPHSRMTSRLLTLSGIVRLSSIWGSVGLPFVFLFLQKQFHNPLMNENRPRIPHFRTSTIGSRNVLYFEFSSQPHENPPQFPAGLLCFFSAEGALLLVFHAFWVNWHHESDSSKGRDRIWFHLNVAGCTLLEPVS